MSINTPVACGLSHEKLRRREATLFARLGSALITTEELADGYALRLPGDKKWIVAVAKLIIAERECCPFLTFEVVAEPKMGPLIVRLTGPAGTKEFLKTILIEAQKVGSLRSG